LHAAVAIGQLGLVLPWIADAIWRQAREESQVFFRPFIFPVWVHKTPRHDSDLQENRFREQGHQRQSSPGPARRKVKPGEKRSNGRKMAENRW
jgi:hypothetical protein